jgi:ubiquinone/menaquinone biosynthesis C-methylase UbiE
VTTHHEVEQWSPLKVWLYTLLHRTPKSNVAIIEYVDLGPTDRFLDVGCGPGAALEYALSTGAKVAGVDPSASMVARAAKRAPGADVEIGSAEAIPFPDDSFTVVINVASFHHWADREAGLREIRRVLAPGGRLHVVEGKLGEDQHGHGLSTQDAVVLEAKLEELGYGDLGVDTIKTDRRHEYVVVSATNPA